MKNRTSKTIEALRVSPSFHSFAGKHSVKIGEDTMNKKSTKTFTLGLIVAVTLVSLSQPVEAALIARFDAAQFTTAGVIATWADSSGNSHDATASSDPTVVLNVQNSLPVVSLDGNDYFTAAHTWTTGSAFSVAMFDNTNWNFFDGLYGATTGFGSAEQYWTGSGNGSGTSWANEAGGGFENSKYLNGTFSGTALTNPTAFNLYSGVDSTPNSFTSWSVGTDRGFGAGRAWEGDIAELIVYNTALTDFDRMGVEVYLDEKWGLGLDLRTTYGEGTFNEDLVALGLTAPPVPEPSTLLLLGLGALGLMSHTRLRCRRA